MVTSMRKVFIYGGCASRDAVESYAEHGLELQGYVARQSLPSAFAPALPSRFAIPEATRPFQRRMFKGDIVGNLGEVIEASRESIDLIVWDLNVERNGYSPAPTGGLVSRNGVPLRKGVASEGPPVFFGTEEHYSRWEESLTKFLDLLETLQLRDKLIVNAMPWALVDNTGASPSVQSSLRPEWFNKNVERYWAAAEKRGVRLARMPQEEAIADPDHKWGPAFFHYVGASYQNQTARIAAL